MIKKYLIKINKINKNIYTHFEMKKKKVKKNMYMLNKDKISFLEKEEAEDDEYLI